MKCFVRWRIAQNDVTTVTTLDEVNDLLRHRSALPELPEGARVFVAVGRGNVEVATGCTLHRRVATAAALQHGADHNAM